MILIFTVIYITCAHIDLWSRSFEKWSSPTLIIEFVSQPTMKEGGRGLAAAVPRFTPRLLCQILISLSLLHLLFRQFLLISSNITAQFPLSHGSLHLAEVGARRREADVVPEICVGSQGGRQKRTNERKRERTNKKREERSNKMNILLWTRGVLLDPNPRGWKSSSMAGIVTLLGVMITLFT